MKTLSEIIEETRDGGRPDYEDLRYAVCALCALGTFDARALQKLAEAERDGKPKILSGSAVFQNEEHFERTKRAYAKPPKEWVGWSNDPDNPEFLARRQSARRLADKILTGKSS